MTQLAIDRRGLGAFGLVVSAGLTVTGSLLPLYEVVGVSGGVSWQLTVTAWQTYVTPAVPATGGSVAPKFGFPLALAAAVEVIAAVLLVRGRATAGIGRMAAVAGSAILLGAAWTTMLFLAMFKSGGDAPPSQPIGIGLWMIGAAWVVGTIGAVLVQDLSSDDLEAEPDFESDFEPDFVDDDEAVIYRIDGNEAVDDVDTPPLGLPDLTEAERFVVLVDEERGRASS